MLVAGFGLVLQLYNLPPITVLTRIAQVARVPPDNDRHTEYTRTTLSSDKHRQPYYHQRHTSIDPMSVSVYQWQRANTELWPVPLSLD